MILNNIWYNLNNVPGAAVCRTRGTNGMGDWYIKWPSGKIDAMMYLPVYNDDRISVA
jgi:hypothetical protein